MLYYRFTQIILKKENFDKVATHSSTEALEYHIEIAFLQLTGQFSRTETYYNSENYKPFQDMTPKI